MKRKKLSIFILSAAIVTSSISYGISAKADELKEVKGYNQNINASTQKGVANNKVSVKKVNGEILGYANPFTMLQILNTNESKVEVITQNGLRGYVNAEEFTLVESAVNDKLIEKNMEGHVTNVSTVLNLRKEPRIGSEIINRLLNNTKVNIIGKQGSWYKIEVNGQKGYVYGMFLNEGTIKENNSNIVSNKKSEVKSEDKKEKNSSVKTDVKKETKNEDKQEVISGAKAKVAQKSNEEAKAKITEEVKPVINKEAKLENKAEVKSETKAEMKNELKTEINQDVKAETRPVVSSEIIKTVNSQAKSEEKPEINNEIKSQEKTETISKENLEVIQETKQEEISEEKPEMKPEVNTKVESKQEMNEEVKTTPEVKVEEKSEVKPVEGEAKVESKKETKQEDQDTKAKEMAEILNSEEYRYLRMSISYGERLVDRKDKYTKESLKALRTELEKAKKVFKDSQNLTMKLVKDTRYDLDKAIVDLVKLSDVKKPAESKTEVEVNKDSKPEKNQEVKVEEVKNEPEAKVEEKQEVESETVSEEKVESKKEVEEQVDNAETIVPEAKEQENKEIKQDEPKAKEEVKSEVSPDKKSREEEIEEILKSKEYRFLLKDIAYGERLADKFNVYTKDSIKTLNIAIEKAQRIVSEPEKLTKKLVEDTRYDLDKAIVELVKRNN